MWWYFVQTVGIVFLVIICLISIRLVPFDLIIGYCIWSLQHPVWLLAILCAAVWLFALRSLLDSK